MSFDELVSEICERLNYVSDDAKSRVGREINARYRRVTSAIGLQTSRFVPNVQGVSTFGLNTMTFNGVEKILAVYDKSSGRDVLLDEVTTGEMHVLPMRNQPPKNYAITKVNSNSVEIEFDCIANDPFSLYADGQANLSTLSGSRAPDFPESFHDILIFGVIADEYKRMEKLALAQTFEADYEKRLSDLRMWLAKSAYLDTQQGKYNTTTLRWNRNARVFWDDH